MRSQSKIIRGTIPEKEEIRLHQLIPGGNETR
jgi:hypothetical protein